LGKTGALAACHPHPQVADRGMPLRTVKRVAPDKEGAADKQCLADFKPGQVEPT